AGHRPRHRRGHAPGRHRSGARQRGQPGSAESSRVPREAGPVRDDVTDRPSGRAIHTAGRNSSSAAGRLSGWSGMMITVLGNTRRAWAAAPRRETLTAGALSLLGGFFNLPSLMALEGAGRVRRPKVKSVIFLYLQGGPATQDMFDMKPAAPVEVRGEFKPIRS